MDTEQKVTKSAVSASPFDLKRLGFGTYSLARAANDTQREAFAKDGRTIVKFVTPLTLGAVSAQLTQFATEDKQDVTERGEPIHRLKFGDTVLVRHEHRTYDKTMKGNKVVELNGKVLDVQSLS